MKAIYLGDKFLLDPYVLKAEKEIKSLLTEFNKNEYESIKLLPTDSIGKKLQEYDILIGGWGGLSLPNGYQPQKAQFYVNLTGTFSGRVTPEHVNNGLRITNWGDSISHTIAESTLMMMLASLKNVYYCQDSLHNKKIWRDSDCPLSRSLFNRKIGLIGCGLIAQQLIKLLKPFETEIYAFDPYLPDNVFKELGITKVSPLETIFREMDIISIHAAKTEETNYLVNKDTLQMMKDDAILVNTARGNAINEKELAAEHHKGRLFSALDVFEKEPLPKDSPLRGQMRCLLFDHRAGPTQDQYSKMVLRMVENIRRIVQHEPLLMELTAEKLKIMT